jgi:hypothetical protein
MNIIRTKFYQAVSIWNGTKYQLVTHLNMENPEVSGDLDLSIMDNVGLRIKANGKSTIITFNNVAYMVTEEQEQVKAKPLKKV